MTTIRESVEESTAKCKDAAAVQLALKYADAIDAEGDLAKLGPKLLAVLESLGLTPKGRRKEEDSDSHNSPVDELKAKRAARAAGQH
jgi:hypothetical protein